MSSIERAFALDRRTVERKCRNLDVKMVTGRRGHLVRTRHESRWGLQRDPAGILVWPARLEHGLFADDSWSPNLLATTERIGNPPMSGHELHWFGPVIDDFNRIGPKIIIVGRRRAIVEKTRRHLDFDVVRERSVHGGVLASAASRRDRWGTWDWLAAVSL